MPETVTAVYNQEKTLKEPVDYCYECRKRYLWLYSLILIFSCLCLINGSVGLARNSCDITHIPIFFILDGIFIALFSVKLILFHGDILHGCINSSIIISIYVIKIYGSIMTYSHYSSWDKGHMKCHWTLVFLSLLYLSIWWGLTFIIISLKFCSYICAHYNLINSLHFKARRQDEALAMPSKAIIM